MNYLIELINSLPIGLNLGIAFIIGLYVSIVIRLLVFFFIMKFNKRGRVARFADWLTILDIYLIAPLYFIYKAWGIFSFRAGMLIKSFILFVIFYGMAFVYFIYILCYLLVRYVFSVYSFIFLGELITLYKVKVTFVKRRD